MSEWLDASVELADGYTLGGWISDEGEHLVTFGKGRRKLFIPTDSAILTMFGKDAKAILDAFPKATEPKASKAKASKAKAEAAPEVDIAAITAAVLAALQSK